jgi:2-polyprenyl-6-methoxyphenol hydroxylase-like FAD-dependent oxidoreductase
MPRRAVIIGGGYIGLEAAEALVARGLAVTLVEQAPAVLPTIDADLGQVLDAAWLAASLRPGHWCAARKAVANRLMGSSGGPNTTMTSDPSVSSSAAALSGGRK